MPSIRIHNNEQEWSVKPADLGRTWFISDPHLDHYNIITYAERPFRSVEEMNHRIVANWNEVVQPEDLVIFIGDMAFGRGSNSPRYWLSKLHGRKIYLKGSHDQGIRPSSELAGLGVIFVCDSLRLNLAGDQIYVVHAPMNIPQDWAGWAIHGHVHNHQPMVRDKRINVSVEATGYRPVSGVRIHRIIDNYDWDD